MGHRVGAGSGQQFARRLAPPSAIVATPAPEPIRNAPSILRFRLGALLAAQLFDFGTFTIMVGRHGIEAEANPIVAQGFMSFGLPLLAIGKAAQVVLVGSILVILGRVLATRSLTRRIATSIALLAVAGGVIGGVSNVLVH